MYNKKGYAKKNIWDEFCKIKVCWGVDTDGKKKYLDPGVIYFIAVLNKLGCETYFSCEGHPKGFYIIFHAIYKKVRKIHDCGYFSVQVERPLNTWSLRLYHIDEEKTRINTKRIDCLRWAAKSWNENLSKNLTVKEAIKILRKAFHSVESPNET